MCEHVCRGNFVGEKGGKKETRVDCSSVLVQHGLNFIPALVIAGSFEAQRKSRP